MFGLGVPEILFILVIALIVFGPKRLPEIGRSIGKTLGEFRKATDDLKNTIEREVQMEELKQLGPSLMAPLESVSRSEPAEPATPVAAVEPPAGEEPGAPR